MATTAMTSSLRSAPAARPTQGRRIAAARRPLVAPKQRLQPRAALPAAAVDMLQAMQSLLVLGELDIDWSDPDTQIAGLGALAGLAVGIGVPAFYVSRDIRDDERLEELRALNRATKEATGEYLTKEEIAAIRPPHWTDGKEFVDDD